MFAPALAPLFAFLAATGTGGGRSAVIRLLAKKSLIHEQLTASSEMSIVITWLDCTKRQIDEWVPGDDSIEASIEFPLAVTVASAVFHCQLSMAT